MDLYGHPDAVAYFRDIMVGNPDVRFFHPHWGNAPWHVIAEVPCVNGTTRRVHFWPHKVKVCSEDPETERPNGPAEIGPGAMRAAIAEARLLPEAADLFE